MSVEECRKSEYIALVFRLLQSVNHTTFVFRPPRVEHAALLQSITSCSSCVQTIAERRTMQLLYIFIICRTKTTFLTRESPRVRKKEVERGSVGLETWRRGGSFCRFWAQTTERWKKHVIGTVQKVSSINNKKDPYWEIQKKDINENGNEKLLLEYWGWQRYNWVGKRCYCNYIGG